MIAVVSAMRSSLRRTASAGLLMTGCLLAAPAAAGAATASSDGTTVTLVGTAAAENIAVYHDAGEISFDGDAEAGPGCAWDESTGAIVCPGVPGGIDVDLGGGDDRVSSNLATAPAKYGRFNLGTGNDFFEGHGSEIANGGPGNDELNGLAGDDELDGGDDSDKVDGGAGADVVRGGGGDDALKGDPTDKRSADVIDGGPGRDSITDWMNGDPAMAPLPTVTLDGVADDGFPGEGDNVTNMEVVESYGALRFVGTPGDDIALASEVGNASDLTGLDGNDRLRGTDASDKLDGGAGDDDLQGSFGNDTIVGGLGKDTISADRDGRCNELHCDLSPGSASDSILARDGEVDTISCGPGHDAVQADAADVVAADCEQVDRAAPAPAPAPGGQPKGLTGPRKFSLRRLKRGVTFRYGCAAACKVTIKLLAGPAQAKRLGTRTIAAGTAGRSSAGAVKVRPKLTRAVKRRAARLRAGKFTLKLVASDGGATRRLTKKVRVTR